MEFSVAQYQSVIDDLSAGLSTLTEKIGEVPAAVTGATHHWYIPEPVAQALEWLGRRLMELGRWVLDKLTELLKGAAAPVTFAMAAWDWETVRGMAYGVAGHLTPTELTVDQYWHGLAADAYHDRIQPQADAAARISSMADRTATSLNVCAVSALAFYVALGVILVKFIAAFITALAAFASAVFSAAGVALIVEEAGVNTGMIVAAVGALLAVLGAQASQMVALHGEAVDPDKFPGGHWPNATPGVFSDATVMDGDAKWSLHG
jgi:hypothetical protein